MPMGVIMCRSSSHEFGPTPDRVGSSRMETGRFTLLSREFRPLPLPVFRLPAFRPQQPLRLQLAAPLLELVSVSTSQRESPLRLELHRLWSSHVGLFPRSPRPLGGAGSVRRYECRHRCLGSANQCRSGRYRYRSGQRW